MNPESHDPSAVDALEERLRESFGAAVASAPPAPPAVRARLEALRSSSPPKPVRARVVGRRFGSLFAAAIAIVVVGLIGSWTILNGPRPGASVPAATTGGSPPIQTPASSSAEASPIADALFLPDQAATGDGWRLIAGRFGSEADRVSLAPHLTLYSDGGILKPIDALHLPPLDQVVDEQSEALLVVDLAVSSGPICGQIRFDGVTFDQGARTMTLRYTPGEAIEPTVCPAVAVGATIVVAIARDHLAPGQLAMTLVRADSSGGEVVELSVAISAPALPAPASETSPVDAAGSFADGGLWATHGSILEESLDGGKTWEGTTMPVRARPFVLDRDHAWLASPSADSTDFTASSDDVLHYVVDRTTDGGRTWTRSTVPGNLPGTIAVFAFTDPLHGYLLAAGERGSLNEALYRTVDGGATWQVVPSKGPSTGQYLGSLFGLGPGGSLWAGTEGDAGPVERPVLDVSRDGGKTWSDARLPGLEGSLFATNTVLGPPTFFGTDGVVAVTTEGENGISLRTFVTSDGGRTWTRAAPAVAVVDGSPAFAAISSRTWIATGTAPDTLVSTDDGGRTWRTITATGLRGGPVSWLGFSDPTHGAAILWLGNGPVSTGLVVTSDGGRTWVRAPFVASTAP